MSVYVGSNDSCKEISTMYMGNENTIKEVAEGYILDSNGNVSQVYSNAPDPGQQMFTSSGTFTVPKGVKSVDVFLVGGGGSGGTSSSSGFNSEKHYAAGGGGGGGYTKTIKGISVTPGQSHSIVVAAGASKPSGSVLGGTQGGTSSAFNNNAVGGYCGTLYSGDNNAQYSKHSNGGSGGGSPTITHAGSVFTWLWYAGNDGASNGGSCATFGGSGQGTTTRAFGESSGTLYSGGGGGGGLTYTENFNSETTGPYKGGSGGGGNGGIGSGVNGTAGTGGGGGGGGSNGGSGCVIIRWGY